MSTIELPASATRESQLVTFDLYRDIHKAIRAELFALIGAAGSVDPGDRCGKAALADHVNAVAALLESHAEHEDRVIEPALRTHLPHLAQQVAADHVDFDGRMAGIVDLAASSASADSTDERRLSHWLYLDLASFASAYLAHQDLEERELMPALERAVGVPAVIEMHGAIVGSIPPDEMARSLAIMLPAMNVDDRTEMLGGIRATAPAEAFDGVVGLARSVLHPADFATLATRLS